MRAPPLVGVLLQRANSMSSDRHPKPGKTDIRALAGSPIVHTIIVRLAPTLRGAIRKAEVRIFAIRLFCRPFSYQLARACRESGRKNARAAQNVGAG